MSNSDGGSHPRLRQAVVFVATLNLGYFFFEFAAARKIGSVSLFADSVDFLEDAAVNFLIALALGWSGKNRARAGGVLSCFLLVPALAWGWTAWEKLRFPIAPSPSGLAVTGAGALLINVCCAFLLARFRNQAGSLSRAAFLSARNDAAANLAIIAAAVVTRYWFTAWPDFIVGVGIAYLNIDAAQEVWSAARQERGPLARDLN